MDEQTKRAAEYWSAPPSRPTRTRWWESRTIVQHINRVICGYPVEGTDGGDIQLIRQMSVGTPLAVGVSIGCGNAYHELKMLESGVVDRFVLYEIAETRIVQAKEHAARLGLSERIEFRSTDAFSVKEEVFDLVYWKDALHHMSDAHQAVRWSSGVLKPGGLFFMNEFVGPTRMQYTARQLELAERARACLPTHFLRNPFAPDQDLPLRRVRPQWKQMIEIDPSECADSENILPAVRSIFPAALIRPTGGVVYALALSDVLHNIDEIEDAAVLRTLLLTDDLCVELGETLYAVAVARKAS